ncbi:MAG TPA: maleylpyruvate isomerase family mycothiol-dependent enzyme [Acidimicrobiales bacterium]|nr:maleylpyruvate isomerase family mycothiol-dependent enzyme [Acidimicrobiales bacterium]
MAPTSTEPVVAQLQEVWSSIEEAGAGLPAEAWERPTDCPGWTVRDHVSHLVGIERTLLGEAAPPAPDGPPPEHVRNPIGELNEAWVADRRGRPGAEVLAEFAEVTARRLKELAGFDTARFDEVGWSPVGQVPYRVFMEVRVFDSWVHEQDMRRALGRPGGRHGAGEEVSLRRVGSGIGFVVGKKVAPPDGTSVIFDVTGEGGRPLAVVMEGGRGREPEQPPEHPTVRLVLDTTTFWRLGCGRLSPGEALAAGDVALTGDVDLGRRVLDAMNIMI